MARKLGNSQFVYHILGKSYMFLCFYRMVIQKGLFNFSKNVATDATNIRGDWCGGGREVSESLFHRPASTGEEMWLSINRPNKYKTSFAVANFSGKMDSVKEYGSPPLAPGLSFSSNYILSN